MFNAKVEADINLLLPAEIVIKALNSQRESVSELAKLEITTEEELLAAIEKDKNWTLKTRVDLSHFSGSTVLADKFSSPKTEPVNSDADFETRKNELAEDLSRKDSYLEALIEKL